MTRNRPDRSKCPIPPTLRDIEWANGANETDEARPATAWARGFGDPRAASSDR